MIDDYYHQASSTGTEHLAPTRTGPAVCGYDFEGRGELVLDAPGFDAADLCATCAAEVR